MYICSVVNKLTEVATKCLTSAFSDMQNKIFRSFQLIFAKYQVTCKPNDKFLVSFPKKIPTDNSQIGMIIVKYINKFYQKRQIKFLK